MTPATWQDVVHIAQTMWTRGRIELTELGVEPVPWLEAWKRRIARGDAVSFGPHAILGWDFETDDVINTSFQASESFESQIGTQITKEMRRAIPKLMEEHGVRVINTYSLCVDPQAEKWFRLLGLHEDKSYVGIQRGPYITRRFFRRR